MSRTRLMPLAVLLVFSAAAASAFAPEDKPDGDTVQPDQGVAGAPKPAPSAALPPGAKAPPGAAAAAAKDIPWNDPAHDQYFKYEGYLEGFVKRNSAQLPYQTKDTWATLDAPARAKEVAQGEAFLKVKFAELLDSPGISDEDKRLVEAVWGKDVWGVLHNVQVARQSGNPQLLKAALGSVGKLQKQLGNLAKIDWNKFFENDRQNADNNEAVPVSPDPLAVRKSAPFLDAMNSPQVKKVLVSQTSFDQFIQSRPDTQVSPMAYRSLSAMYAVISKAQEPEKSELAHIMPTVVKFIQDGHRIMPESNGAAGALAWAIADDYGKPKEVAIGPAIQGSDPLVTGNVLAHEFEHIYDDYTGRIYTLDSELRGFKTNVMFTKTLQKVAPEQYKRLTETNDDSTREQMNEELEAVAAYDRGTQDFVQEVAYGHHYINGSQGYIAQARLPLRDAIGPGLLGLPHALAATQALRDQMKPQIESLEKQRDDIQAQRAKSPSRSLDDAYQRVAKDLAQARERYAGYDAQSMIQQDQLTRMQREAAWLDANNKAGDPPPYDLKLAVDKNYLAP